MINILLYCNTSELMLKIKKIKTFGYKIMKYYYLNTRRQRVKKYKRFCNWLNTFYPSIFCAFFNLTHHN